MQDGWWQRPLEKRRWQRERVRTCACVMCSVCLSGAYTQGFAALYAPSRYRCHRHHRHHRCPPRSRSSWQPRRMPLPYRLCPCLCLCGRISVLLSVAAAAAAAAAALLEWLLVVHVSCRHHQHHRRCHRYARGHPKVGRARSRILLCCNQQGYRRICTGPERFHLQHQQAALFCAPFPVFHHLGTCWRVFRHQRSCHSVCRLHRPWAAQAAQGQRTCLTCNNSNLLSLHFVTIPAANPRRLSTVMIDAIDDMRPELGAYGGQRSPLT